MKRLKDNLFGKDQGFIVQSCFVLFYILERISLFFWIRWIVGRHDKAKESFVFSYIFPEIWVVGNMIIAILSRTIVQNTTTRWVLIILSLYAVERTFEMLVYQINVLFFHKLNNVFLEEKEQTKNENNNGTGQNKNGQGYQIKSATRTVILLIFNIVEYILQFAVIFSAVGSLLGIQQMHIGLTESFLIFMNLGDLTTFSNHPTVCIAFMETLIGLFMNILCIAYFIGMLPTVRMKENN